MRRFPPSDGNFDVAVLSAAEGDILHYIGLGYANKEIAHAMDTTVRTIESYIADMLRGLGFSNRVQLARWAYFYPRAASGAACEVNLHLPGCPCSHPLCVQVQRIAAMPAARPAAFALARAAAI